MSAHFLRKIIIMQTRINIFYVKIEYIHEYKFDLFPNVRSSNSFRKIYICLMYQKSLVVLPIYQYFEKLFLKTYKSKNPIDRQKILQNYLKVNQTSSYNSEDLSALFI